MITELIYGTLCWLIGLIAGYIINGRKVVDLESELVERIMIDKLLEKERANNE